MLEGEITGLGEHRGHHSAGREGKASQQNWHLKGVGVTPREEGHSWRPSSLPRPRTEPFTEARGIMHQAQTDPSIYFSAPYAAGLLVLPICLSLYITALPVYTTALGFSPQVRGARLPGSFRPEPAG